MTSYRFISVSLLIFCMAVFLYTPAAQAQSQTPEAKQIHLTDFAKLTIMHEGRLKPIDSFARAMLKQFSGSDKHAIPWLVETLFNPAQAENIKTLKISNPALLNMLDIQKRKTRLYTYKEISTALKTKQDIFLSVLKTPEENWTPAQRDLVFLQRNTALLGDLLSSFSLFIPLSITLPEGLPDSLTPYGGQPLTYLDVLKFRETLQHETTQIVTEKGEDIDQYSKAEQAITFLSFIVTNLQETGQNSHFFRVIPQSSPDIPWVSLWQLILGEGHPDTTQLFNHWFDLSTAYHTHDPELWQASIANIQNLTQSLGTTHIRKQALFIEFVYNQISPFVISAWLYVLCLLCLALRHRTVTPSKQRLYLNGATLCLASATLIHIIGIATRVFILERPPVSTLYETVIFVGATIAAYSLIVFWMRNKDRLWLIIGAGSGLFLTLLSFTYNQNGDSLLMLTAVLNTNFWLSTHVICITLGYAFCLITSMLAHIALARPDQKDIFKHLKRMTQLSLLFVTVGTVLGGIWADQSWGRFWGWDPKENGALLIVLWLIWLLHGQISKQMKEIVITTGLAALSIIVALSWFGVNLLGVGLHTYGFSDAAVFSLGAFILIEVILMTGLIFYRIKKHHAI